jgi:nitroreductase
MCIIYVTVGVIMSFNRFLEKTIQKSQHCNRNWDLTQQISDEDMETLKASVTECSSKQNRVFYKVVWTQDRDKIEKIHDMTNGFTVSYEEGTSTTNPQVLANTLFAFIRATDNYEIRTQQEWDGENRNSEDEDRALGIATGYLTLTANLLGYDTGCCQCMMGDVREVLNEEGEVLLLMGVGKRDITRSRLEHHNDPSFRFPSFSKTIEFHEAA